MSTYDLKHLASLYSDIAIGRLVAVNVFGEPFFESGDEAVKISPETGGAENVCALRDFDFSALDDYWTAKTLKAEWENLHGQVGNEHFLVPVTAFTLGGEFSIENLMRVPLNEAVGLYRQIRKGIRGLPDGSVVSVEVMR